MKKIALITGLLAAADMLAAPVKKVLQVNNPFTGDDWKYMGGYGGQSAYGYDADIMNFLNYMGPNFKVPSAYGYDADFRTFDPFQMVASMDKKELRKWLDSQVASGAMSAYKLRVYYTPGVGTPANVNVTFFQMAFNTDGVFNGNGDLVFTNSGGDTATITGMTTGKNGQRISIQTLFELTKTEPFTIGFVRMKPKTTGQFDYSMSILNDSQFGGSGSNSITPDDYVDPDQFQLLRVDVPMNVQCSNKKGFSWEVDPDQTGNGISMTLFIPQTLDPGKQLEGKPAVRVLNDGISTPFFIPTQPNNQLKQIAQNDQVQAIMRSGVNPAMGQKMIAGILPNLIQGA